MLARHPDTKIGLEIYPATIFLKSTNSEIKEMIDLWNIKN